jgi:hypothetical protein
LYEEDSALWGVEMNEFIHMVGLSLAVMGCTTTTAFQRPPEPEQFTSINEALRDRTAAIKLADERKVIASAVSVDAGAVRFTDQDREQQQLPLEAVRNIRFASQDTHSRGLVEGLGFGVVGGLGLGLIVAIPVGKSNSCSGQGQNFCGSLGPSSSSIQAIAVAGGIGLGAIVGSIIGAVYGHHEEWVVEPVAVKP